MARRKRAPEEHENHERWLVSYADFITLLFAFFVVMYAISSINEGKYRVLSSAIVTAFKTGGSLSLSASPPNGAANTMVEVPKPKPISKAVRSDAMLREQAKLGNLAQDLRQLLDPLVKGGQVKITQTEKGVSIEIRDSALFPVGQAQPSPQSRNIMIAMGQVLNKVDNPVSVEGFTDNIPISNPVFPSNWELSAARAGSVVRLFQETGLASSRLVAIGRAENNPVADNNSNEGRAQNRRVSVTVLAKDTEAAASLPLETLQRLRDAGVSIPAPAQDGSLPQTTNP